MNYIGAFSNLKTSRIYDKITTHKAILLLTIIEMYETCKLHDNVIQFDDKLKDAFVDMWKKVMPNEITLFPEVYVPFWHMQAENFWHIVPISGKEDIFDLLNDPYARPSEIILKECIDYVELDEDLYFLMTIQTGRSSLKRVLLENYTNLPKDVIDTMSVSVDNFIDNSQSALKAYENMLNTSISNNTSLKSCAVKEVEKQFYSLSEDIQYVMNIEYYSFLKNNYKERDLFKEICPTIFDLFDKITNNPIEQTDILPSVVFIYENFLSNLKISLMSEEGSFDLIDKINNAINHLNKIDYTSSQYDYEEEYDVLQPIKSFAKPIEKPKEHILKQTEIIHSETEQPIKSLFSIYNDSKENSTITKEEKLNINIINQSEKKSDINSQTLYVPQNNQNETLWTEYENELITLFYNQGYDLAKIAKAIRRTEAETKIHLSEIGLIEDNSLSNYYVENSTTDCYILNQKGENVYITTGKFKIFHDNIYRFNYKDMLCFTVKRMTLINNEWEKGNKKLVAYKGSPLFSLLDKFRFIDQIEDFKEDVNWMNNLICVDGKWFDYKGNIIDKSASDKSSSTIYIESCDYEPKGKIKYIYDIVENSYDYLWMMAIIDFMKGNMNSTYLNYDNIACMMIANAWEILSEFEQIKEIENILVNCIEYLIKESNEYMSNKLSWSSPKDLIYNTIKSYPMTGIFEDTVDLLLEKAPYRILRPWIRVDNIKELIMYSLEFSNSSLYAIHIEKANSYIEINPNWKSYLHNENDNLRTYFKCKYLEFVTSTL